jgi:hypothetical protein
MIVGNLKSSSSRRRYCKDNREVKLIHTKPSQPLRWSEQPITFSRADHWVHIPDPGSYPLVVEPIVKGALLPQTLIYRGSVSYGPPWAHYLGGYQDRLLGGPLGLPDLRCTAPDGVKHKDYRGEVLGKEAVHVPHCMEDS